jgi:hypothetical protein
MGNEHSVSVICEVDGLTNEIVTVYKDKSNPLSAKRRTEYYGLAKENKVFRTRIYKKDYYEQREYTKDGMIQNYSKHKHGKFCLCRI